MSEYRYVGEGAGVAGLPHSLTDEEAAELGVTDLLMDALKNGAYQEIAVQRAKPKPGKESE